MEDGKARTGFLAAVLRIDPESIRETRILNANLRRDNISILDFILFQGETEFHSCFHIREDKRHFLYTDKMEFHVIELPKLPEALGEDCTDLELWAKFISAERKEEFDMLAEKNPYIDSAYQKLQVISQDSQKRLEYEAREKAIRDYNEGMYEAEQRGIQIGERNKSLEYARNMKKEGIGREIILKITGLSPADIDSL